MKRKCKELLKQLDIKYEYRDYIDLEGIASKYFYVPRTLIRNTWLGDKRVSVFTYLSIYRGLNNKINFSIPMFLNWAKYKSNTHSGGINDKVIETMDLLSEDGYVIYKEGQQLTRTACLEIMINPDFVGEQCETEGYGVLYVDEVDKIMNFNLDTDKDTYFDCNTILLVFAYLRDAIYRTSNELKPEERSPEGIADRKKRLPEAYNDTYKDIAYNLGISERSVSKAVQILEEKLHLIVTAKAYHFKNENGEYRTPDIIFANAYKREDKKLLTFDEKYAMEQIENKANLMRVYFEKYYLRERKVLFEKVS